MTIQDVAEYIRKNYEDKCPGYSLTPGACDEDELVQCCSDFFYYEVLGWCGCGTPEKAKRCVRDYLYALSILPEKRERLKQRFGTEYIYDNELLLCLAYMLDAHGLTEHGGSIGGAWLTRTGEVCLACFQLDKELEGAE